VLKQIEAMKARGLKGKEFEVKLSEVANKFIPIKTQFGAKKSKDEVANLRKDHISHFILRLAYCQSEELRRWFLSQEALLFRHRITVDMTPEERHKFLEDGDMNFDRVDAAEKAALQSELFSTYQSMPYGLRLQSMGRDDTMNNEAYRHINPEQLTKQEFYKVPFTEAVELIKHRHAFVKAGFAYLPVNMLIHTIVSRFRANVSTARISTPSRDTFLTARPPPPLVPCFYVTAFKRAGLCKQDLTSGICRQPTEASAEWLE
jgi:DNA primase large subunit